MTLKLEGEGVGQFNEILVKVAVAAIYGCFRPSVDDAAPINGFEPKVILQAATLVSFSRLCVAKIYC